MTTEELMQKFLNILNENKADELDKKYVTYVTHDVEGCVITHIFSVALNYETRDVRYIAWELNTLKDEVRAYEVVPKTVVRTEYITKAA